MSFVTKPDTGSLFTNDKKANAKQPDYTGKIVLSPATLKQLASQAGEAVVYVSGWKKKSAAGAGWLSLSVQVAQAKSMSTAKQPPAFDAGDGEIDF